MVKDDALLATVDEVKAANTLGFEDLGMTPASFETNVGQAVKRFRKDAISAADAGMQI